MLTKLKIRNFKRFEQVEIELGNPGPVVFIGPNDSGKTTALQALALWDIGLRRWLEKRAGKTDVKRRSGVAINRRDLISVPIPEASLLWRNLRTHDSHKVGGKQATKSVRVEIVVEGITQDKEWSCGLEFDYANDESFYCRPLKAGDDENQERMVIPDEAREVKVAFLPPMSGLLAQETRLDIGAINVRLGEGRTAEVLRNLCYIIVTGPDGNTKWNKIQLQIESLFGVKLGEPRYITERGDIAMTYQSKSGFWLDLSSSGRGLLQTLLLLAHLTVNPGSVLLLDEPDAHLEILRQRQIYQLLTETAREQSSQIIIASHSEIVLNEAASRDVVVAFVGKPHRIDNHVGEVLKSLREIGFDQYYQAENTGWVLYLEGSTDLAILRAFAEKTGHVAKRYLDHPFVHYVANTPKNAHRHFYGLREAKKDLVGFALFDRLDQVLENRPELREYAWQKREIENYISSPEILLSYAEGSSEEAMPNPLFLPAEQTRRIAAMRECIEDFVPRAALRDPSDRWWSETKASDEFLDRLFDSFFKKLALPNLMTKSHYYILAKYLPKNGVQPEVIEVLDAIVRVAESAKPVG